MGARVCLQGCFSPWLVSSFTAFHLRGRCLSWFHGHLWWSKSTAWRVSTLCLCTGWEPPCEHILPFWTGFQVSLTGYILGLQVSGTLRLCCCPRPTFQIAGTFTWWQLPLMHDLQFYLTCAPTLSSCAYLWDASMNKRKSCILNYFHCESRNKVF